jgi:hypothetical protein
LTDFGEVNFLRTCLKTEGLTRIYTDETDLRTGKSKNNAEIQASFTGPAAGPRFRMTTKNKEQQKTLNDSF